MLLQKESLTLTDTALVPVLALALALAMAFGLTVLGVLMGIATVTKGAVRFAFQLLNYSSYKVVDYISNWQPCAKLLSWSFFEQAQT